MSHVTNTPVNTTNPSNQTQQQAQSFNSNATGSANGNATNSHRTIKNNSSANLPKYIDLAKWEDSEFIWSGSLEPASFNRLQDIITHDHKLTPIEVSCHLYKNNNITWLKMSFEGDVWVTCQRCLKPLAIDVTHKADLALLYDESQQRLLDEDIDYVLLEEATADDAIASNDKSSPSETTRVKDTKNIDDYLAMAQAQKSHSQMLPLAKLIEDELLLDVPLSPKHDDCEMILDHVGDIEEEEEENPFAALAALKGKL